MHNASHKAEKLVEGHCQGEANMHLSSEKKPEVTKLTGDIWNAMTPAERETLRVRAKSNTNLSIKGAQLEFSKYWDEYFGEEKRALIRAYKPKLPVCTLTKAKKLERCILSVKDRNVAKGCKAEGTGSKKCPSPWAVCQSSLKCKVEA